LYSPLRRDIVRLVVVGASPVIVPGLVAGAIGAVCLAGDRPARAAASVDPLTILRQ
jgi:hypothetical protein